MTRKRAICLFLHLLEEEVMKEVDEEVGKKAQVKEVEGKEEE